MQENTAVDTYSKQPAELRHLQELQHAHDAVQGRAQFVACSPETPTWPGSPASAWSLAAFSSVMTAVMAMACRSVRLRCAERGPE